NQRVVGSSPTRPTNIFNHLQSRILRLFAFSPTFSPTSVYLFAFGSCCESRLISLALSSASMLCRVRRSLGPLLLAGCQSNGALTLRLARSRRGERLSHSADAEPGSSPGFCFGVFVGNLCGGS